MGNSISASDIINYTNIDYTSTQKMMSLSIGSENILPSTQVKENDLTSRLPTSSSSFTNQKQSPPSNVFNVNLPEKICCQKKAL